MTAARSDLMALKPCPFCGGEPSVADASWVEGAAMIYCAGEECMGPRTTAASLQDATVQWNIRAGAGTAVGPEVRELRTTLAKCLYLEWLDGEFEPDWKAFDTGGLLNPAGLTASSFYESADRYLAILSLLSGAGTKSDGRTRDSLSSEENEPVVTRACGPSDSSPGPDVSLSAPVGEPVPRGGAVADWWAESIKLYRQNKLLRKALLEQHDWHLAQGEKDFGEGITLNMADEYSDSGMCERTTAALDAVLPSGIEGYEKWKAQNTHRPAPAAGPDVREAMEDLRSHRGAWRDAIEISISASAAMLDDADDVAYWKHELAAFDRTFSALTRPLGGFVQGSIARKQSTDTEGSSRTETAGGEG